MVLAPEKPDWHTKSTYKTGEWFAIVLSQPALSSAQCSLFAVVVPYSLKETCQIPVVKVLVLTEI